MRLSGILARQKARARRRKLSDDAKKSARKLGLLHGESLLSGVYLGAVTLGVRDIAHKAKFLAPGKTPKGTRNEDQKKTAESRRQNVNDPAVITQVHALSNVLAKRTESKLKRQYGSERVTKVMVAILTEDPRIALNRGAFLTEVSKRLKKSRT